VYLKGVEGIYTRAGVCIKQSIAFISKKFVTEAWNSLYGGLALNKDTF